MLITGGSGTVGGFLRKGLPPLGWSLRLLDVKPVEAPSGAEVVIGDILEDGVIDEALEGVDAVVHLAGIAAADAGFDDILRVNIDGTQRVFEAARRAGVPRIVYASSNHSVGFTPRRELLPVDTPLRPDTFYGLSKAFGESLARLYVDKFGLKIACLRIGSCFERPFRRRHLSTWLSPGDAVRLFDAALRAPELEFATVYGISANTRGWWDLEPGRRLGFQPQDDAEEFAEALLGQGQPAPSPTDPDEAYAGGSHAVPYGRGAGG